MSDTTTGTWAAERLLAEKETLARAVTAALYRAMPHLLEKYGERGREKCLQDMRYNLEHLAPAVDLAHPGMFADYVRWLDGLLRARDVATNEVIRTLELMETEIRGRFPADEAAAVLPSLHAGLEVLRAEGGGE